MCVCNIRIFWTVSILFVYFTYIFFLYLSYSIKQSSPNYILIFYSFFFWFAVFMVVFSILMGFHIISLSYSSILLICHNSCIFMLPLQYFPVLCVIFHSNIVSMRTKNPRNIISWKKDISIPEWNATLS